MSHDLYRMTAAEAVRRLKAGEVSPSALVEAAFARIAETDKHLNALPTLCPERALAHAGRIEDENRRKVSRPPAWLGGLPVSIKDLMPVAGVRTTFGSPIYADHVPATSDILVEILEANGAIVIGKSNTPEFGAGASTFNEVFGKTHNPWNVAKSCAGSSGGAAVSVAVGQVWLAHGSDLGGSLRTPASFCSIVGLRPSPGRVPRGPVSLPFSSLLVNGPMARNVPDVALFLDAMTVDHPRDPLALPPPTTSFAQSVREARPPRRIAYSRNLGQFPVDKEVAEICAGAVRHFTDMGAIVEEADPDLHDAVEIFQVLRAAKFAAERAGLLRTHRDRLKPEVIWNIEKGLTLDGEAIGRAEIARGALYDRVCRFFARYDLLVCPTAIVPPFDVDVRYVEEVDGVRFDNYVGWIGITFALTLTACPVLSLPAGFTASGLPVGLQILAPPRADAAALAAAALFEQASGIAKRLPLDPLSPSGTKLSLG
ncbi:MAG: amidase [Alphaproteobacteria bacterium]|nr:amidase [Alphaproteobacteria bacterium]